MLYEVITRSGSEQFHDLFSIDTIKAVKTAFIEESTEHKLSKIVVRLHVITSYSIHYTKLYD